MDMSKMTSGVPMVRIDGAKVRSLRETKGLTQLFVATSVGVTTDTISRWENKRYPTIKKENGLKLAEALEVELAEILEEKEPDVPTPAPEAPAESPVAEVVVEPAPAVGEPAPAAAGKKLRPGYVAAALLFICLAVLLGWWLYPPEEPPVFTAQRLLPRYAVAGKPFPVSVTVATEANDTAASLSLILRENLPQGATLVAAVPDYSDFDAKTSEVKWLRKIEGRQVFAYMVKVNQAEGPVLFSGKVALPRTAGLQIEVSGDTAVQMSQFHWADANADGRISDEEILTVYDKFSDIKGIAINIDQIEEIWLGSGYVWNAEKGKFEVLP